VDSSHGPECNAEEPACNYQICTPDVLLPTTFLHPLQAIPVVPPVTLQRPKTPTIRRERESQSHMVHGINSLGMGICLIRHQSRSHTSQMDFSMFSMKEKLARRSRPELRRITHVSKGYGNGMRA
jgi:hypothetical protein